MFFTLSKTLGLLFYPLPVVLLLFVVFFALRNRRPRLAWGLFWTALLLLYALSTKPVSDLLLVPLERPFEQHAGPSTYRADAIVVLGGSLDLARSTADRLELGPAGDRLLEGVLLAKALPGAALIFSGGTGSLFETPQREAELLRGSAIALGIAPARVRAENRSRNTRENAVECKRILDELGARTAILVTSGHHMRRALGCFRKVGVDAIPYAVDSRNHRGGPYGVFVVFPEPYCLDDSTKALKEYVGLVVYKMKGDI